jgi:hypothetical protein
MVYVIMEIFSIMIWDGQGKLASREQGSGMEKAQSKTRDQGSGVGPS